MATWEVVQVGEDAGRPVDMAAGLERQTVKGALEAESMVLGCTEPEAGTSPGVLRALGLDRGQWSQKCSWGALGTSHPGSPQSWPHRGHWGPLENLSGACLRDPSFLTADSELRHVCS